MLSCSELNCSTSLRMNGPSPPVKPFQNARLTFGPLYVFEAVAFSSPPASAPVASSLDLPPQLASRTPSRIADSTHANRPPMNRARIRLPLVSYARGPTPGFGLFLKQTVDKRPVSGRTYTNPVHDAYFADPFALA